MEQTNNVDIVKTYLKDMSKYSQLSADEEKKLYKQFKSGDMSAREELIVRNWRLVVAVANKYKNSGIQFLDLVSQGNIGLMRGLENYDDTRGTKVSTYCTYWIQQAISRAIMEKTRNIKIPVYISENLHKIRNFQRKCEMQGIIPSNQDIADALGISLFVVEQSLKHYEDTLSLDAPMTSGESAQDSDSFYQAIQDETAVDPIKASIFSNQRQVLNDILETLKPRQRDVIKMYFGIGRAPMTFQEIGKKMGFSKERACQIEKDALFKLRNPARAKFLVDFYKE